MRDAKTTAAGIAYLVIKILELIFPEHKGPLQAAEGAAVAGGFFAAVDAGTVKDSAKK